MTAVSLDESVEVGGVARHLDMATATLDHHARAWRRLQKTRNMLVQFESDPTCKGCRDGVVLPAKLHKAYCAVAAFALAEARASAGLERALRRHPLWPWLAGFPGLGGGHVALVIGATGDPRRFPGQRCSEGHYLPAGVYAPGTRCPVAEARTENENQCGDGAEEPRDADSLAAVDSRGSVGRDAGTRDTTDESIEPLACPGVMLPPRPGTGTRSYWHWLGLHVNPDGRAPRKMKGVVASWNPVVRASVLQPGGIAEQIVRLRVPTYSDVYAAKKAALQARVAESGHENGGGSGDAATNGADVVGERDTGRGPVGERMDEISRESESGNVRPLRPFEADRIARVYAAKQFLADMLHEWKRLAANGAGGAGVSELPRVPLKPRLARGRMLDFWFAFEDANGCPASG